MLLILAIINQNVKILTHENQKKFNTQYTSATIPTVWFAPNPPDCQINVPFKE